MTTLRHSEPNDTSKTHPAVKHSEVMVDSLVLFLIWRYRLFQLGLITKGITSRAGLKYLMGIVISPYYKLRYTLCPRSFTELWLSYIFTYAVNIDFNRLVAPPLID